VEIQVTADKRGFMRIQVSIYIVTFPCTVIIKRRYFVPIEQSERERERERTRYSGKFFSTNFSALGILLWTIDALNVPDVLGMPVIVYLLPYYLLCKY